MYKLLTNQDPPSVSDLSEDETEDKHLALPMPNVSGEMKKLVVWMMQVNRLKRPKNVGEIREFLKQSSSSALNDEETKAYSPYQSYASSVSDDEKTMLVGEIEKENVEEGNLEANETEESEDDDSSTKKARFIVIFLLGFVVICFVFMSRGCGQPIATNANYASADSDTAYVDSMVADTMEYYGEDYSYGYHEVTYEDGSIYKGEFKDGNPDGKGVMEWPNAKNGELRKYEGEFTNGTFNGKGRAEFSDGSTYDGSWSKGNKHGYGVITWPYDENHPDYMVQFEGNFKNGLRSGKGTAYYGNHNYQTGVWKKDEFISVTDEGTWN